MWAFPGSSFHPSPWFWSGDISPPRDPRLPSRGVVISGTTILPGGATATIFGTPIRLDPSGTLFLGTTSVVFYSASTGISSVLVPILGQARGVEGPLIF